MENIAKSGRFSDETTELIAKNFLDSEEALNLIGKYGLDFRNSEELLEVFTKKATNNPNSKTMVLGRYKELDATSYENIGKHSNSRYFSLDDELWSETKEVVGDDGMWKLNSKFLDDNFKEVDEIIFNVKPDAVKDGYLLKEIDWLKNQGVDITKAIPRTINGNRVWVIKIK